MATKKTTKKRAKPAAARNKKTRQHKRSALLDAEKRAIGVRLKAKRLELGLTREKAAEGIINKNHLYLVEVGKYALGSAALSKLAERYGATTDWILGKQSPRNGGAK